MELRMARQIDWNALMRAVLLIAMTIWLLKLAVTGTIRDYIHPKFTWFTASAGLGMLVMAAGQLLRGLRGVTSPAPLRSRLFFVYTLVICTGFLLQPYSFGADLASKQGLNITNRESKGKLTAKAVPAAGSMAGGAAQPAGAQPAGGSAADIQSGSGAGSGTEPQGGSSDGGGSAAIPPAEPPATAPPPAPSAPDHEPVAPPNPKPGQVQLVNNTAVITPQNFWNWMNELYGNPAAYTGKRVTMDGFVFYPPGAGSEEFAVTRLVVTCHVAHAYPDGLLAVRPGVDRPAEDTWYRVEGLLEMSAFQGQPTLRIKIEQLTAIAKPSDPYIYP